jgi:indolepyruvate ferredoxin oxidoreductase alpha subunit
VAAAHAREILSGSGLWDRIPLYHVVQPYPLHHEFISRLLGTYDEVLVLEETAGVIEMQIMDRGHGESSPAPCRRRGNSCRRSRRKP